MISRRCTTVKSAESCRFKTDSFRVGQLPIDSNTKVYFVPPPIVLSDSFLITIQDSSTDTLQYDMRICQEKAGDHRTI